LFELLVELHLHQLLCLAQPLQLRLHLLVLAVGKIYSSAVSLRL
jgi:hypothetical protein